MESFIKEENTLYIDYGLGKIKVLLDEIDDIDQIEVGYTISISGFIKMGWIKTYLVAQQISILIRNLIISI